MNLRIVFLILIPLFSLVAHEENPIEVPIEGKKKEIINWVIQTERGYNETERGYFNESQDFDRELLRILLDEITTYQKYCESYKYKYQYLLDKLAEMKSLISKLLCLSDDNFPFSDSDSD